MKEFTHYILTRFNTQLMPDGMLYDNPDKAREWMDERMELFKETRKSILSQEGEFTWVISLDKRTPNRYIQDIITDYRMKVVYSDIRDTFKEIKVKTPWVITTRFDCDDMMQPGFIQRVQDHFQPKLMVLDVRFEELDPVKRMVYAGERRWAGSMFISLIEPSDKIHTAFCRPHGQVASEYPISGSWDEGWGPKKIIDYHIIDEPLAYMVCHGNNIANKIRGNYLRTI